MLLVLGAAAILFAQAQPDAAPRPAAAPAPAVVAPNGKTVSPLVVTPEAKPTTEVKQNTMVCHNETVVGSMVPKKVCATNAQLKERRGADQAGSRPRVRSKPLAQ